ncbi:homoserine kinase [Aggregatilinea lenta]|uniref:homoserine kinase n=1 Tax=Aggregatilinea lenta TaxID=913108 RepID=UPI0013C3126D|nr:homoserine kinase [Aggregatilinea lenta]
MSTLHKHPVPSPVKDRVTVYAPATVANLGVGFDIVGMALDSPGDKVTVEAWDQPGVDLVEIIGDGGKLPTDPEKNTACIAAFETLRALGVETGVRLWLDKGLPLASGLGSSAASAAAAAVAVNELFGAPLDRVELLPPCVEAEAAVSGRHADNVAPALLGGIVLIISVDPPHVISMPVPDNLHIALVTANVALPTVEARAVLPSHVSLRTMVTQTALVAGFVHALHVNDLTLLANVVERDTVVSPARTALIPGLEQAQIAARAAGALAAGISGAGPTIFALCDDPLMAERVTVAFEAVYIALGIECTTHIARPYMLGATVLDS